MENSKLNKNLLKKVIVFMKKTNSLKYLNPNIFDTIDIYKEINDISFTDYYLDYMKNLPKLDFDSVVKISREVYQQYGKEKDFDRILEKLRSNYNIDYGSLNKDDDNFIAKTTESRVLLSGTYYDVVLLCHEIGHKLRYDNSINSSLNEPDIMDTFFFETPSIVLELTASDHLRDNYGVNICADEIRKQHILSITREYGIENKIFSIVNQLLKEGKLSIANLYQDLLKEPDTVEYLSRQGCSVETCVDEVISDYSYDIGYILGNYINSSENKIENLDMILKYKDCGINTPFNIDESVIKETLENTVLIEQTQNDVYVRNLVKPSPHVRAFISSGLLVILISALSVMLAIFLLAIKI